MIARPKTSAVLMFMHPDGCGCNISVYPQQRWGVELDGDMVRITYKTITAKIGKDDFGEIFKMAELIQEA